MFDRIKKYIVDDDERIIYFNEQVYVVNFFKILEISEENVTVKGRNNLFIIKGSNLSLRRLLDREVLISGKIKAIEVFYDK